MINLTNRHLLVFEQAVQEAVMAEIILIQPYTGAWDEMSTRFPESLLAVAAVPVARGYDVRLIDRRVTRDFEREFAAAVGPETVLVGVTAITGQQIRYALETTRFIKENFGWLKVCWGGVHATLLPEQTAEHPLIDYVVVGDGDLVFCELFERLRDGEPVAGLRGIAYRDESGTVVSTAGKLLVRQLNRGEGYSRSGGTADVIRSLDDLPELPYQLLDIDKYTVFYSTSGLRSATLNTSRGCPYRCKFCSDPVINEGAWRGFSARRTLEKVDLLYSTYGYKMIYFQDDYFPGPKRRFIEILEGLAAYKRELRWATLGVRADTLARLSDEEWDLLYASGCHSLEIGIESGNEQVVERINKAETVEQMRSANAKLAQYDIAVKYTFIIGFPGETEDQIMDTLRFAAELESVNPNAYSLIFNFLPIVGTPFYAEAVAQGVEQPATLEEWAGMDFDGWMKKYRSWATPELVRKLEAISFVSYFHNRNVAYKFGGSALLRTAFRLYHPIASWRFRHQYYDHCVEIRLKDAVLGAKYALRRARNPVRRFSSYDLVDNASHTVVGSETC